MHNNTKNVHNESDYPFCPWSIRTLVSPGWLTFRANLQWEVLQLPPPAAVAGATLIFYQLKISVDPTTNEELVGYYSPLWFAMSKHQNWATTTTTVMMVMVISRFVNILLEQFSVQHCQDSNFCLTKHMWPHFPVLQSSLSHLMPG